MCEQNLTDCYLLCEAGLRMCNIMVLLASSEISTCVGDGLLVIVTHVYARNPDALCILTQASHGKAMLRLEACSPVMW